MVATMWHFQENVDPWEEVMVEKEPTKLVFLEMISIKTCNKLSFKQEN